MKQNIFKLITKKNYYKIGQTKITQIFKKLSRKSIKEMFYTELLPLMPKFMI
jgi:hypothetical protein